MGYPKIPEMMAEQESQLCIGLDLHGPFEDKIVQAEEIIEATSSFAVAYKPNRQYWLDGNVGNMKELTKVIHKHKSVAIIDHKLSDIGSSNKAALSMFSNEGFDYYTLSPFPGNITNTIIEARGMGIGTITLIAMSNPEAIWMVESLIYRSWARECQDLSDGIVVGTTNHIKQNIMESIADVNKTSFVLAPGLGHQGGSIGDIHAIFGQRVLFTVSRGISNSPDYYNAAEKYSSMITNLHKSDDFTL